MLSYIGAIPLAKVKAFRWIIGLSIITGYRKTQIT
jgi:hypothetical protein